MVDRVLKGDRPISGIDAAALIHDIEYYRGRQFQADNNMFNNLIREYPYLPGIALYTRFLFLLKDVVGYDTEVDDLEYQTLKRVALQKGLLDGFKSEFRK